MESRKRRTRRSRSFMREQEEYSDISIPIAREREDKPVRKRKKKGVALPFSDWTIGKERRRPVHFPT